MSAIAVARLIRERNTWRRNHPDGYSISLDRNKDGTLNLFHWHCTIPRNPEVEPEGGTYSFTLKFNADYPLTPPRCLFPRFDHYCCRAVCWSVLNIEDKYVPELSIEQMLVGIYDECPYWYRRSWDVWVPEYNDFGADVTVDMPLSLDVKEGETVTLKAKVTGRPVPDVTWRRYDSLLSIPPKATTSFSNGVAELTIPDVATRDEGEYKISAKNCTGHTAAVFTVTVITKSTLPTVSQLVSRAIYCNDPFRVHCTVTGNPKPTVEWYRGTEVIVPGAEYDIIEEFEKSTLLVKAPNVDDSGFYKIVATNEVGTASSQFLIFITNSYAHLVNVRKLIEDGHEFDIVTMNS